MTEPIIELKKVSFSAQNTEIVHDISLHIEEGKTTALVGPSGGGKSTVLKLSAGLLVPSQGAVTFRGKDISLMSRVQNLEFRREAAVVFQDSALWANQSLYQILELPLKVHYSDMTKAERDERIREVISMVGYKRDLLIRPAMLSMGEQKLIAFARALLCRPSLLYLDEWTESLDDDAAYRLVMLVKRMQSEHKTIIFVSHDFRIIKGLADTIIMVVKGVLSLELTKEQILADDDMARLIEKGIES
ncbi:MAG: ATP-binding cassette domain-containing protein [Treponema sp.]|jgi:ABC-type transporter Mla maintaining outer membrane lipid asymmetry ATPase subunit MlaF|nr:ATP-binding cassette domain-containing protein [Treponema sp.]